MSDRLTQIAAVVTMLRNGQIASFEAVAQVLKIMQRDCEITDPTPQFFSPEEEITILCSACPLLIAGLKEALPDQFPEVLGKLTLFTRVNPTGVDFHFAG